ncbi:MAG: hypothetical protein PHZ02_03800 [Desulfocapsaceae bacterium]|nr:hypothetical protein [Desulfocapsaceae bacterium]
MRETGTVMLERQGQQAVRREVMGELRGVHKWLETCMSLTESI